MNTNFPQSITCRAVACAVVGVTILYSAAAFAAEVSFPSQLSEAREPRGIYAVVWNEATERKRHELLLKTLKTGKTELLLQFDRQVDILWSPDGRHVAVTNWVGSNVAEIVVFRPRLGKPIDLADVMDKAIGVLPQISGNDHVYFEALQWLDRQRLRFKVFGHGDHDRNGFEQFFDYDISGSVRRAKTK